MTEYEKDLKEFVEVVQTDTSKQKQEVEKTLEEYKDKVGKSIEPTKLVENFNSTMVNIMGPAPPGGGSGIGSFLGFSGLGTSNADVSMGGSQL